MKQSSTVTDLVNGDRSKEVQDAKEKDSECSKEITTKESDIKPLMEKKESSITG
jgi:hypothetical protein